MNDQAASPARLRSLVWDGRIPIRITLDPSEVPAGADRAMEEYYVSAPRLTYLALLLPAVKTHFLSLLLDETAFLSLVDANIWFEHSPTQTALRWHWPVGLLYDTLVASSTASPAPLPLQLTLRLSAPPSERLLLPNTVAACRDAFLNQIKEADFVRFGSTRRVTNLRQREAESLWDGLQEHDFDKYWAVANKLVPSTPNPSAAPSPQVSAVDRLPDVHAVRSVPLRIYLPHGAATLQSTLGPMTVTGAPTTLYTALNATAPLLFPEPRPRRPLAKALIHGAVAPYDAELGWLGSAMCGADGWVSVAIQLEPAR